MLTIYSKSNCAGCTSAANLLTKYNVPFKEVKIDEDEAAKSLILARGYRTVPQIFNGDKLFVQGGWLGLMKMSEEEIKAALYGEA